MFPGPAPIVFPEVGLLSSKPRDVHLNLSSPQVCKSGAFGAGLTALAAHKLAFLDHVSFGIPNCTF